MTKSKKDFSSVNTGRVYDTITEATAAPEPDTVEIQQEQEIQNAHDAQEKEQKRKARRTYTDEEAKEIMMSGKSTGRKGVKLPRINLAFTPDIYDYIQTMSRAAGETMTDFVNFALRQHMEEHHELYEQAIEFRKMLDNFADMQKKKE